MATERTNVSSDLVWLLTRMSYIRYCTVPSRNNEETQANTERLFDIGNQNSFLVKRKSAGGTQLSRDPLNLQNKPSYKVCEFDHAVGFTLTTVANFDHSKYAGYANDKVLPIPLAGFNQQQPTESII